MFIADQVRSNKIRNLTNVGILTAVVVFAVMLFDFCCVMPLSSKDFIYFKDNTGFHMSDFVLFYASGKMSLAGDARHAYDPAVQLRYINALIAPNHLQNDFFLQQAPFMFAVMIPLGAMPLQAAYLGWVALLTGLTAATFFKYLRCCKGFSPLLSAGCCAYLFCSLPAALAWKLGQPVWLALSFYLLYLFALETKRPAVGGLAVAACLFKPQYGIILGLHALCTKQWRTVLWAAAGAAVLLIISLMTVGWDNVIHYPRILHDAESSTSFSGVCPEYMISIRAVLAKYVSPVQALDLSSLSWAVAAAIDCILFLWAQRRSPACGQWAFAVAICAGLVFSPHTHVHDTLLLAAAFAVTRPTAQGAIAAAGDRLWVALLFLYVPLSWVMHSFDAITSFQKIPFLIYDCVLLAVSIAMLIALGLQRDTKYDAEPLPAQ